MPQTVEIPQTFLRPPSMAQNFRESYAGSAAGQVDPQVPQQPQSQPTPQAQSQPVPQSQQVVPEQPHTRPAPPPKAYSPILPSAIPSTGGSSEKPAMPASSTVTAPAGVSSSAPAAPTPAQPQTVPGSPDSYWQRQMEAERAAFAQREQQYQQYLTQQNERLAKLEESQRELELLKNQEELHKKLASDDAFKDLETLDANDARRIIQMTAETLRAPLTEAQARLEQERQAIREELQRTQQNTERQLLAARAARSRDELLAAHPDFFTLYNNDVNFRQYLSERDGLSSRTREQSAMDEYNAGNVAYVIDMINRYKGQTPQADAMRSVPPVQVAAAAPQASEPAADKYTLSDLNYWFHTGQITQDQYRALKKDALDAMQTA